MTKVGQHRCRGRDISREELRMNLKTRIVLMTGAAVIALAALLGSPASLAQGNMQKDDMKKKEMMKNDKKKMPGDSMGKDEKKDMMKKDDMKK
jgi:pentapeptide MXKDX repeat protein